MAKEGVKVNVILIRELMAQKELNIKQLAESVGISREAMSKLINKRAAMSAERLGDISEALGVPSESLLVGTDQLLMRRFEQILVQFSLNQSPVEISVPELFDLAVKLGYAREVSPWDQHLTKSTAQESVEEVIKDL